MASLNIVDLLQSLSLAGNKNVEIFQQFASLEENLQKNDKNDGPAVTAAAETLAVLAKSKNTAFQVAIYFNFIDWIIILIILKRRIWSMRCRFF